MIRTLGLPQRFELSTLVDSVQQLHQREIHIEPVAWHLSGPCGFWFALEDYDLVVYEEFTSVPHQVHIAIHELAHVAFQHQGLAQSDPALLPVQPHRSFGHPAGASSPLKATASGAHEGATVRARTGFATNDEVDAELFATLLGPRIVSTDLQMPQSRITAAQKRQVDRLARSLEQPISTW